MRQVWRKGSDVFELQSRLGAWSRRCSCFGRGWFSQFSQNTVLPSRWSRAGLLQVHLVGCSFGCLSPCQNCLVFKKTVVDCFQVIKAIGKTFFQTKPDQTSLDFSLSKKCGRTLDRNRFLSVQRDAKSEFHEFIVNFMTSITLKNIQSLRAIQNIVSRRRR